MTGEEIILKQYSYQIKTKNLVVELLEQGKTKADIAHEIGIYVNEVTQISNEIKKLRKQREKEEEEGTTGHKLPDLLGIKSL